MKQHTVYHASALQGTVAIFSVHELLVHSRCILKNIKCFALSIGELDFNLATSQCSLGQGLLKLFILRPILKKVFQCDPLIESLNVDDTCKHPITNIKRHLCLW